MMDINEVIMDLQFDFDLEKMEKVKSKIHAIGEDLENQIQSFSIEFDRLKDNSSQEIKAILEQIRNRYLKQKYVLRLRESLDKFASL
jgi:molecular chaperone HscB